MENTNKAEGADQPPLRIGGKSLKRLLDGSKQDGKADFFVVQDDRVEFVRQGEDIVVVAAGQKFRLAVVKPLFLDQRLAFRAMPVSAGIVGILLKITVVALLNMPSECCGTADFNMMHYSKLITVSRHASAELIAVLAEYVGYFKFPLLHRMASFVHAALLITPLPGSVEPFMRGLFAEAILEGLAT